MSAKQRKGQESIRDFNEKFPIGTIVKYCGKTYKTWAPAGLNFRDEPAVFLASADYPEPVLLTNLEIDGYTLVVGAEAKKERRRQSKKRASS